MDLFQSKYKIHDYIALTILPISMYLFGGQTLLHTLAMYNFIIVIGSLHYGIVGLHAAHHHPELFHDGDEPR